LVRGLLQLHGPHHATTMRGSILASIPMSEARFGLLSSFFLWTYGLFGPLAGILSEGGKNDD